MKDDLAASGHEAVIAAYKDGVEDFIVGLRVSKVLYVDRWRLGRLRRKRR